MPHRILQKLRSDASARLHELIPSNLEMPLKITNSCENKALIDVFKNTEPQLPVDLHSDTTRGRRDPPGDPLSCTQSDPAAY